MGFFKQPKLNHLAGIAESLDNWELLEQKDWDDRRVQYWKCTYKHPQKLRPNVVDVALCEGFADDEDRMADFKKALVDSQYTAQEQTEMLLNLLLNLLAAEEQRKLID